MDIQDKEKDLLIKDFDFDGIKEFDNPPPPWIMWMFYISIFFSALYLAHYHWVKQGDLQDERYEKIMAEVEKEKKQVETDFDESEIKLLKSEQDLAEGKKLYTQSTCNVCHGNLGEGNTIGPNLTDEYWLNGGSPEQVFRIIKYGNSAKGMTPFKDQLTNEKILQLTSYILIELKGTNPPNAKEPQGEKVD